ncbi:MAG: D-2-hydroxyacid dehydrogenase [Tissierellia bacterium]|nr:D-2-hydroxyacid dehydrogenase [Tissierellia bacterium]
MIGIIADGNFLKREDAEREFPKVLEGKEEWEIYESFDSMLEDRDKIEIMFSTVAIDGDKIKGFKNLKWIFSYSAGVDIYPLQTLKEMGVFLTNTSGVHAKNISEQVIGAMIAFSRNFIESMKNKRKKKYDKSIRLGELVGQKLLIVGTGAIGKEIARKADFFEMEVDGVRSKKSDDKIEHFNKVFSIDEIDNILGDYQYIVSVLPSTEKTKNLFDKKKFNLMNKDAVFMNVGRGDLVVEADLIDALENHKIRGAYLDVYNVEPLEESSKLWDLDNILMTPHNAGITPHYLKRSLEIFDHNLRNFREGKDLINIIDYKLGY